MLCAVIIGIMLCEHSDKLGAPRNDLDLSVIARNYVTGRAKGLLYFYQLVKGLCYINAVLSGTTTRFMCL